MRKNVAFCIAIVAVLLMSCERKENIVVSSAAVANSLSTAPVGKLAEKKQVAPNELTFRAATPAEYPLIASIGLKELDPTEASVATFDLDGDGGMDLVVVAGRGWCGSLGCSSWVVFSNGSVADLESTNLTNVAKVVVQKAPSKPAILMLMDEASKPILHDSGPLKGTQIAYTTVTGKSGRPELAAALRDAYAAGAASQSGFVAESKIAPVTGVQKANLETAIIAKLKQSPVSLDSAPLSMQEKMEIQKDTSFQYAVDRFGEKPFCYGEFRAKSDDSKEAVPKWDLGYLLSSRDKIKRLSAEGFFGPGEPIRIYTDERTDPLVMNVRNGNNTELILTPDVLQRLAAAKRIKLFHGKAASKEIAFFYDFSGFRIVDSVATQLCAR